MPRRDPRAHARCCRRGRGSRSSHRRPPRPGRPAPAASRAPCRRAARRPCASRHPSRPASSPSGFRRTWDARPDAGGRRTSEQAGRRGAGDRRVHNGGGRRGTTDGRHRSCAARPAAGGRRVRNVGHSGLRRRNGPDPSPDGAILRRCAPGGRRTSGQGGPSGRDGPSGRRGGGGRPAPASGCHGPRRGRRAPARTSAASSGPLPPPRGGSRDGWGSCFRACRRMTGRGGAWRPGMTSSSRRSAARNSARGCRRRASCSWAWCPSGFLM